MPAPKMPAPLPTTSAERAVDLIDGLLTGRTGWKSTNRGWHHKKTGLTIEARAGNAPFHVIRHGAADDCTFTSTIGLELFLAQAGA